jgi:hypothetical protein
VPAAARAEILDFAQPERHLGAPNRKMADGDHNGPFLGAPYQDYPDQMMPNAVNMHMAMRLNQLQEDSAQLGIRGRGPDEHTHNMMMMTGSYSAGMAPAMATPGLDPGTDAQAGFYSIPYAFAQAHAAGMAITSPASTLVINSTAFMHPTMNPAYPLELSHANQHTHRPDHPLADFRQNSMDQLPHTGQFPQISSDYIQRNEYVHPQQPGMRSSSSMAHADETIFFGKSLMPGQASHI